VSKIPRIGSTIAPEFSPQGNDDMARPTGLFDKIREFLWRGTFWGSQKGSDFFSERLS
jgi:hypothetical protein